MGILYTVSPLDSAAKQWLRSQNIAFPDVPARWPHRGEVEQVLRELRGFTIDYTLNGPGHRWDAYVSDRERENWTLLHAEPQDGDDDVTHIRFEKGEPTLIVAIIRSLAASTGPFMLLPDVGGLPIVVSPSLSVMEIVADHFTVDESSEKWRRLLSAQTSQTESAS